MVTGLTFVLTGLLYAVLFAELIVRYVDHAAHGCLFEGLAVGLPFRTLEGAKPLAARACRECLSGVACRDAASGGGRAGRDGSRFPARDLERLLSRTRLGVPAGETSEGTVAPEERHPSGRGTLFGALASRAAL